MQLLDGSTSLGTVNLTNGQALFPVTFTTMGTHPLTAVYAGDATFGGVTSAAVERGSQEPDHILEDHARLRPRVSPGLRSRSRLTLSQTAATGTVDFVDGINGPNIPLGTAPLINGTASITTSVLTAGTHEINATYSGDANYISARQPQFRWW